MAFERQEGDRGEEKVILSLSQNRVFSKVVVLVVYTMMLMYNIGNRRACLRDFQTSVGTAWRIREMAFCCNLSKEKNKFRVPSRTMKYFKGLISGDSIVR